MNVVVRVLEREDHRPFRVSGIPCVLGRGVREERVRRGPERLAELVVVHALHAGPGAGAGRRVGLLRQPRATTIPLRSLVFSSSSVYLALCASVAALSVAFPTSPESG